MIGSQTNELGQVAVKYYQQVPKRVEVSGNLYIFGIRAHISMAWVEPEHVQSILNIRGGCCGQKNAGVFRLANEDDVRRWTNGGGR